MAFSRTPTYGQLDRWQVNVEQRPYAFHQCDDLYLDGTPEVWIQSERDSLAATLMQCVTTARKMLGYNPFPMYQTSVVIPLKRDRFWHNQDYYAKTGQIIAFGTRATELIQSGVTVVYSDVDGDGKNDTATVTVTSAVITNGVPQLFFTTTDGRPSGVPEPYRIYPTDVRHNGTAYVFSVPRWRMVKPTLYGVSYENTYQQVRKKYAVTNDMDGTVFAGTVDVYRVYTDSTNAVQLIASPIDPATAEEVETVLPVQALSDTGWFRLQNKTLSTLTSPPYAVRVSYLAGLAWENELTGTPNRQLELAIARHSLVEMPMDVNAASIKISSKWSDDGAYLKNSSPLGSRVIDHHLYNIYGSLCSPNGTLKGK